MGSRSALRIDSFSLRIIQMKSSDFEVGPYDMCPCQSGKKYKFCCAVKAKSNRHGKYPIGTVAFYGPDNKVTTKIAAAVILKDSLDMEPDFLERWVATDVTTSPKVLGEIKAFFAKHGVKSVVVTDGNLGCPHEEGIDFKMGHDCPICHYWAGKQGTARVDDMDYAEPEDEEGLEEDDEDFEGSDEEGDPMLSEEEESENERLFLESLDRSDEIVEAADGDFQTACEIYGAYMQENLALPCRVRLANPYAWEEPFFDEDQEEPGEEYETLKAGMPSIDDTFQLVKIQTDNEPEWTLYEGEVGAWVVRESDGKGFSVGLGNLEIDPDEGPAQAHNMNLLNDYGIWITDVNLGFQEMEAQGGNDDDDDEQEDDDEDDDRR